ncbi:MAG: LacI family DNA-binding transcriptional regulator [Bacteroidales bacterium]|nr:LacI family DNA-binding transcriptional regulator [Bacteroidales bacterium]MBN2819524.1 LacI family DNA-binding transcriptional regulator [Bacteroidales bacterium]
MKSNKEVTIYDIAATLGISASTVSRALSDHPSIKKETKKKIRAQAKQMGYQQNAFASNLRRKRSNTIGVIVPRLDSYFMASVIAGIETEANKEGYNLIISQSQESLKKEEANISTMYNSRVDGLLVSVSDETENLNHLNLFLDKNIPVVLFDRVNTHPKCTCIVIDNYKAAYEATQHLIEQGCKKILYFTRSLNTNVYQDRHNGYKQALIDNKLIYNAEFVSAGKLDNSRLEIVIDKIVKKEITPDAIFAANDHSAVVFICKLKEAGIRVPHDIAVVGFNNNPISKVVDPNLTTVHYPGEEMGSMAASTLIEQITKKKNTSLDSLVLYHELIIRNSSLKK